VSVRVQWLTGDPTAAAPPDLSQIRVILFADDSGSFSETNATVSSFETGEGGRRYVNTPLLSDLPTGQPIRITIEGYREGGGFAYVGHVGPIVLRPGERRHVDLKMFELDRSINADVTGFTRRCLHTATSLPDGRVLVTGGFDDVVNGAPCAPGAPAESRCFDLTATASAFVFEPSSGRMHPLRQNMLEARAGHTATLLPDGRVLLAGGAPRATFVLSPIGVPSAPSGFAPDITPHVDGDELGALDTFEIFDPGLNAEEVDAERDGDPARGGFVGAADAPTSPGRLNQQRFLHAAVATPDNPERVLLAGGMGGGRPDNTFEVFDDRRPGGYGFYGNVGSRLSASRMMPSAVALTTPAPGSVWIFGGVTVPRGRSDLADVWTPDDADPNGSVADATTTEFPNPTSGSTGDHPELALLQPTAVAVAGSHALVLGWMGPRCVPGTTAPVFSGVADGSDTELCAPPGMGEPTRAFVVNGETGTTEPQMTTGAHAFGAVASLDDGSIAVTGGLAGLIWTRQPLIEIFTGQVSGGTAVQLGTRYMLNTPRAFHTTSALADMGILSVGGLNLSTDVRNMSLYAATEVLYPGRVPVPRPATP